MTTATEPAAEQAAATMLAALRRWYAQMFGKCPCADTLTTLRRCSRDARYAATAADDLAEIGLIEALVLAERTAQADEVLA